MIVVEIRKLDSEDDPVSVLNVGEHIFGRGPLLQCDDRRVSRNHGVISITNDAALITSTHENPCFFQSVNSKTITILPKNVAVNINDGDKFALLADQFWFKIKLKSDFCSSQTDIPIEYEDRVSVPDEESLVPSYNSQKVKRDHEEESNEQTKKFKTDTGDDNASDSGCEDESSTNCVKKEVLSDSDHEENSDMKPIIQETEIKVEAEDNKCNSVKNEVLSDPEDEDEKLVLNADIKSKENLTNGVNSENDDIKKNGDNTSVANGAQVAGTSGTRPWRDYCVYGLQCYRKSASHLSEFTHPGDSDYESDPNDQRPICAYAGTCYRKNKDHRKAYKHPRGTKDVKKPTGTRAKKKDSTNPKKKPKPVYYNESSEDEYDMDDPFMADSGSEFEVDGISDDTDSDVSEEADEEFNRVLKEAKRFTRSKKKNAD